MNETEIKLVETTSTEVKSRLIGSEEILRTIDTGALYVGGKGGVPQALVTATSSESGVVFLDPRDGTPLTPEKLGWGVGGADPYAKFLACGMPFVIPAGDGAASGLTFTGGGGGAFTLSGAILSTLVMPAAYFYLPANAGGSGCAAGWYYTTMSSTIVGVIYGNTFDPASGSVPTVPASPTTFAGSPTGRITQVTTELTVLQKTLPAGVIGKNGYIEAGYKILGTATAGAKTARIRAGSVVLHSFAAVASNPDIDVLVWSRMAHGSMQSQINTRTAQSVGGSVSTSTLNGDYTTADFTAAQPLIYSMQIAANTETMVLYPSFIKVSCVN